MSRGLDKLLEETGGVCNYALGLAGFAIGLIIVLLILLVLAIIFL